MSPKTSGNEGRADSLTDLLRIRDILFGEQMVEYGDQFSQHAERMDDLQAQLNALAARIDARHEQTVQNMQNEIAQLREMILARLANMAVQATTRAQLGEMLVALGEQLKQEQHAWEGQ